ncbi:MAG: NAD(P)H-dependent oxidoreductase [Azospirillaceae bacterium]
MHVLLVHAHPVPESYNAALRDAVRAALEAAGHSVDLLDLYAEGFVPVLSAEERRIYHDVDDNLRPVAREVERLRAAEALVLVYPTWWYGMPAILKGWFDRVWLPGVAFTLPEGGGPIRPALTGIRKIGVVTSSGSPRWFLRGYMGDPGRRVILRGLKPLCAPRARSLWLCHYSMDASTPESRARFLGRVDRAFRRF